MALQTELKPEDWRFCVAPMIDWTDEWCRHFHRLLSKRARLYTEMIASPALVHGNRARLLGYEKGVNPVALQLGGSNPAELGGKRLGLTRSTSTAAAHRPACSPGTSAWS